MERFPCLEAESYLAYIADNAALGIHCAGYNGVASLIPRHSGNNLFVPAYAGLNYETISLQGLAPYAQDHDSKFEPRSEPMRVEEAASGQVVLVQPETSHAHVSARIVFRVEEPHYLHQRIELTFHRRFCRAEEQNAFSSLFASYMHMPPDLHIYLKPDLQAGDATEGWVGVTKKDHLGAVEICALPDGRLLSPAEHLEAMETSESVGQGEVHAAVTKGPLAFYYGFCPGDLLFLMMFEQPGRFRLAYSPSGAGQGLSSVPGKGSKPAWNPAWDYVLCLDDAEIGRVYAWDLCLAIKPFAGQEDVLREVRDYLERGDGF